MHIEDVGNLISSCAQALLLAGWAALGFQLLTHIRLPRRRYRLFRFDSLFRALPVIGFMFSVSPAAAARSRSAVPPTRSLLAPAPPWSRLDGSPPPLPFSRAQGPLDSSVGDTAQTAQQPHPDNGRLHPAIHRSGRSDALESVLTGTPQAGNTTAGPLLPRRLFLRAGTFHAPTSSSALVYPGTTGGGHKAGKREHAAGGRHEPTSHQPGNHDTDGRRCDCYIVMPGDNLWEIAARKLETRDGPRIADYWLAIYQHNRDVIGPNPDLVRPGQVLELPHE
jgi:hypothetical protein